MNREEQFERDLDLSALVTRDLARAVPPKLAAEGALRQSSESVQEVLEVKEGVLI